MNQHILAMQDVTPSINDFPAEILAEVFLWQLLSVTHDEEVKDPMVTFDRVSPLVCKSWRAIALGDPRLWTHIVAPDLAILETFTQRYLPRSGNLPLDLEFRGPPEGLAPFIAAMFPYAARWGSLDLRGPCESLRRMTPVVMPVLRHVRIEGARDGDSTQHVPLHFIRDAPKLDTLMLHCWYIGSQFELALPPLGHLRTLRFSAWEYDLSCMLRTVHGSCATLRDIEIVLQGFVPPTDFLGCPAHLPSLTSLTLGGSAGHFLQLISPPALETLTMTNEPEDTPALLDLLHRVPAAGHSLQKFDLQSLGDYDVLLECLALTPNLKVLCLGVYRAPGPLLRGLTIHEDDSAEHPILVPKLELLSLDYCIDSGSEDLLAVDEFFISRAFPQVIRGTQVEGVRMAVSSELMQTHSVFARSDITLCSLE
ncbi:uncharacterized protein SCHCODRAFT_02675069 [Schizophyllum commune H4-8]|uniref:Uncharacterized protein n=1 Tax=Schizophyllum commune (strain H4-8 / FGSC 9210) TaxID=578458 RepID=D8PTU1_SCHCM|nr:uncharacterized protein SCHCODRAFT_02675069 [Schizophyllum commune H4-8]KAI5900846.1 hypothetical protein SCHCODRAFT_02675069 [Schizophyllum commune H4-8]